MSAKTVLLTGATGFIAAHVLDILLQRGYKVKATVRSKEKGDALIATRQQYKDKRDYDDTDKTLLNNIKGAFDEAVKGVEGVLHVASPFHFNVTNNEKDLLIPAINGTKSVLQAAANQSSVKRIVITSSFAAVVDPFQGFRPGYVYSEKDWSPLTYEDGKTTTVPVTAYRASKVLAEKAAWEFVEKEKPQFDIVTLCPPMVFGPIVHPIASLDDLNTSNAGLWAIASGKVTEVPETRAPIWVDVRDVALAHVEALERPVASNKRYALCAGDWSNQQFADILHARFDWSLDRVPKGIPGQALPAHYSLDATLANEELGITFRGFEEAIIDTITQFKQIEDGKK